jgi:hypothetical protein
MPEVWRSAIDSRSQNAKPRVAELAARQLGRVSRAQLLALGISNAQVGRWINDGYLQRVLPHVYAVGFTAPGFEAELAAGVLYAGPGAMLSHLGQAWWIGVLDRRPPRVQVSTPRRRKSLETVEVFDRRPLDRIWLPRAGVDPRHAPLLPVTPIPRLALDLAQILDRQRLRYALAQLDFQQRLDVPKLEAVCGQGIPGSAALRDALREHQPLLALTRSDLERLLIGLCERHGLPMPEINAPFRRFALDAVWWLQKVVVEVDGRDNHSSWAQIKRDRRKDLELRRAGFLVLRYTYDQIRFEAQQVAADIRAALAARAAA